MYTMIVSKKLYMQRSRWLRPLANKANYVLRVS